MKLKSIILQKIIGIALLALGIWIMLSGCSQKICPTYDSAIRAQKQKGITIGIYQSNHCEVKIKQKKSK